MTIIIFGNPSVIILFPQSINSDIHFVQGLVLLGFKKNIKAGSTQGDAFPNRSDGLQGAHPHFGTEATQRRPGVSGPLPCNRLFNLNNFFMSKMALNYLDQF